MPFSSCYVHALFALLSHDSHTGKIIFWIVSRQKRKGKVIQQKLSLLYLCIPTLANITFLRPHFTHNENKLTFTILPWAVRTVCSSSKSTDIPLHLDEVQERFWESEGPEILLVSFLKNKTCHRYLLSSGRRVIMKRQKGK